MDMWVGIFALAGAIQGAAAILRLSQNERVNGLFSLGGSACFLAAAILHIIEINR